VGFLRVKTVKEYRYVYWCKRVRSRKKYGGSGKVKSPDLLLGDNIVCGKYLSFYFHTGDVPLREYTESAITYILENDGLAKSIVFAATSFELAITYILENDSSVVASGVKLKTSDVFTVEIDWYSATKAKVCLHSKDNRFDCRRHVWRQIRQKLQNCLEAILKISKSVQDDIELTAFCLAKYKFWTKKAQAKQNRLQEYRKNPTKTWTQWESEKDSTTGQWHQREVTYTWKENADIILDKVITNCDKKALWFWDNYHERLNQITNYAPRQRQEDFRHTALSQIEKLAKDDQWAERYEWQLKSALLSE